MQWLQVIEEGRPHCNMLRDNVCLLIETVKPRFKLNKKTPFIFSSKNEVLTLRILYVKSESENAVMTRENEFTPAKMKILNK